MTKEHGSKKAQGAVGWCKHKRPFGKRLVNKANRKTARQDVKENA